MEFDVKASGAGSAGAILSDPEVASVYGAFGDGCLKYYKMDIREKKSYLAPRNLRMVQSFASEYGSEDGIEIMRRLFSGKYRGKWKGEMVGLSIFNSNMRWLADKLLAEAEAVNNYEYKGKEIG